MISVSSLFANRASMIFAQSRVSTIVGYLQLISSKICNLRTISDKALRRGTENILFQIDKKLTKFTYTDPY